MIETCLWELPWQKALKGDREKTNKALKGNGGQAFGRDGNVIPEV